MPPSSPGTPASPRRRRQRSVRVSVAVALLAAASGLVLGALAWGPRSGLGVSAILAVGAGWACVRILLAEVAHTRRDAAAETARQSRAFRAQAVERSAEHTAYAEAMAGRLGQVGQELQRLESVLQRSERRAGEAVARVRREARRANEAEARVVELEEELEVLRGVEDDTLAVWEPAPVVLDALEPASDTVVDLLAWEDRATVTREGRLPRQRRA